MVVDRSIVHLEIWLLKQALAREWAADIREHVFRAGWYVVGLGVAGQRECFPAGSLTVGGDGGVVASHT